ncbi:helix-turn-helix domain-containing protein [Streptomyces albidoflavus]
MVNRRELDPERSPSAAFGALLRRLRDEVGWTQEQLGDRVGCSGAHISALEIGRRPPTRQLATRCDQVLSARGRLVSQSQAVRHTALIEGFPQYVGYEERAVEVRLYEVGVIPGLLQTLDYSRAIEAAAVRRGAITPEVAEERVSLIERRQAALDRSPPPLLFAVLDEGCLLRPLGTPEVMNAQFAQLLAFAERPNTVFQIAPFRMGPRRPLSLPLILLTMPDRSLIAYAESSHHGRLDRNKDAVVPLLTAYHQLQAEAMSQAASVAMIEQLRKGTS